MESIGRGLLRTWGFLFHGYLDELHRNIDISISGFYEPLLLFFVAILFVTFTWYCVYLVISFSNRTLQYVRSGKIPLPQLLATNPEAYFKKHRWRVIYLYAPAAVIITLAYASLVFEAAYATKAAMFVDRSKS